MVSGMIDECNVFVYFIKKKAKVSCVSDNSL